MTNEKQTQQPSVDNRQHPTASRDGLSLSAAEQHLRDQPSVSQQETQLEQLLQRLQATQHNGAEAYSLKLAAAGIMLDLNQKLAAYDMARPLLPPLLALQRFEDAALTCQYLYLANTEDAIAALGQAAWLAVSFPVDPNLTANILDHLIDETPDNSDGAAVAAATAHYVADLRGTNEHEDTRLFTSNMLARVARRHSGIESQREFELWVERLQLDQPEKFLIRLRNVIDVMVQDQWWFDRTALQREMDT